MAYDPAITPKQSHNTFYKAFKTKSTLCCLSSFTLKLQKMIFKAFITILVIVAFAHHCVSETYYGQACNTPPHSCLKMVCQPAKSKDDLECKVYFSASHKPPSITVFLKHLQGNDYSATVGSVEITDATLVITKQGTITKFILKHPNDEKGCCATNQQQITDEQKKEIAQFCKEEGMQLIDNSHC